MLITLRGSSLDPAGSLTGTVGFVKVVLTSYIGIGLLGFVVSHDTSHTTVSLRFGDERDCGSMNGGILAER